MNFPLPKFCFYNSRLRLKFCGSHEVLRFVELFLLTNFFEVFVRQTKQKKTRPETKKILIRQRKFFLGNFVFIHEVESDLKRFMNLLRFWLLRLLPVDNFHFLENSRQMFDEFFRCQLEFVLHPHFLQLVDDHAHDSSRRAVVLLQNVAIDRESRNFPALQFRQQLKLVVELQKLLDVVFRVARLARCLQAHLLIRPGEEFKNI